MIRRTAWALSLLLAMPAMAQDASPALDNDRVTAREVTLEPGGPAVTTDPGHPFVIMFLEDGRIRASKEGKHKDAAHVFGDAIYGDGAAQESVQALSGHPRLVLLTLKEDKPAPPIANTTGLPLAFPRPGSKKILENDRVIVWTYTWQPNKPTPMHYHDKDTVVTYRYDGLIKSTARDGSVTDNTFTAGQIKFNKADRVHTEMLTQGRATAVIAELK